MENPLDSVPMAEIVIERTVYWYYPEIFLKRVASTAIALIEFILALRFILELLGANPVAPFVAWVYNMTDGFVAPFSGAFQSLNVGGFVLDLSTVFAMIGYAIIGGIVSWLLGFLSLLRT